jgi:serine/threonine protein kinase
MAVITGQRVGEYVLEQPIGKGGFGQVWRARHHAWTEQVVAIKIPTDPNYLRDLQREGTFAPALAHVNIVKAIGFDPYAQVPYLAMEYVPGTSLRPIIESKKLTIADTVAILKQLLAALQHAHAAGFIHRDVKPENVLIHERSQKEGYNLPGIVKLSDFGLGASQRKVSAESIALSINVGSDAAKEFAGTIDYMSPELKAGGTVDGRADLYATGIMLFEMLTGTKPSGAEVPSDVNSKSPGWLDDVYRKACARVEKRYVTADEFAAALSQPTSPPPMPSASSVPKTPVAPTQKYSTPAINGRCPTVEGKDQFCISCGTQLVAHVRRCPSCGGFPDPDDRFCILCGSELTIPVR